MFPEEVKGIILTDCEGNDGSNRKIHLRSQEMKRKDAVIAGEKICQFSL